MMRDELARQERERSAGSDAKAVIARWRSTLGLAEDPVEQRAFHLLEHACQSTERARRVHPHERLGVEQERLQHLQRVKISLAANGVLRQLGVGERAHDRRHPEAEVVARAEELPEQHHHGATDEHPHRQARHSPLALPLEEVRELDERRGRERDRDREDSPLQEEERSELDGGRSGIVRVRDAQQVRRERARREVADERGDHRRGERAVLDPTEHDELEPEHGARDRCAEDRAEAARHARRQELSPQGACELQAVRHPVGEARAHLHRGPLAARRCRRRRA